MCAVGSSGDRVMEGGLTLVCIALTILATGGKGSNSSESGGVSGEDEDFSKTEKGEKNTGAQHKFWIPTYKGTNPLNRKQISITNSEIERYDKSIDVSLSGVAKNRTKPINHRPKQDALSMPIVWSGEDGYLNISRKYDVSIESSGISIESGSHSSYSRDTEISASDSGKIHDLKIKPNSNKVVLNQNSSTFSKSKFDNKIPNKLRPQKTTGKLVRKDQTSTFFNGLGKSPFNETVRTSKYYRKIVKDATENTKKKLKAVSKKGVIKKADPQTDLKKQKEPNIIQIDTDNYFETPQKRWDEIEFQTSHKQLRQHVDLNTSKPYRVKQKYNAKSSKDSSTNKSSKHDSSSFYDLDGMPTDTEEDETDSFTEDCDYSSWSDILSRNKTERKANKRKPKTKPMLSKGEVLQDKGPLGKEIKNNIEKLRKKDGMTRKKKRQRELKKRERSTKTETRGMSRKMIHDKDYHYEDQDYQYEDQQYPGEKIRMRTTGEKRHAINEVKGYLNKMDNKYGGRPGRKYTTKNEEQGYKSNFGDMEFKRQDRMKNRYRRSGGRGGGSRGDKKGGDWGERDYREDRRYSQRERNERDWNGGNYRKETSYSYGRGRERDDFRSRGRHGFHGRGRFVNSRGKGQEGFRAKQKDDFRGRRQDRFRGRGREDSIGKRWGGFRDKGRGDNRGKRSSPRNRSGQWNK